MLDSGASHHVVGDLSNVCNSSLYGGSEGIFIGSGAQLSIDHIRESILHVSSNCDM